MQADCSVQLISRVHSAAQEQMLTTGSQQNEGRFYVWSHHQAAKLGVVGQNPTLRIRCPLAHCTLLHWVPP